MAELVVEDGTGLTIADSYISLEQADLYHEAMGNEAWATLGPDEKIVFLRRASRDLDILFSSSYLSTRLTTTQALQWPRVEYKNEFGVTVTGLPRELVQAVAELALVESTTDVLGPISGEDNVKHTTKKLGSLEKTVEYFSPSQTYADTLRRIRLLLSGLVIGGSSRYVRVGRG
jgi:hypothetical protein